MESSENVPPSDGGVKSARRALEILEELTRSERPIAFAQLARRLGLPRSSLHALIQTMLHQGWLEMHNGGYTLGVRTWEAGNSYLRARTLVDRALPMMQEVRDHLDEIVQLAILDGTQNVYIAKVDPSHALTLASEVGRRLEAHATGLGKALLSGLTDDALEELYEGRELKRFTNQTITDIEDLKAEVRRIEENGYAFDNEEYTIGVRCVAVPIRNHTGQIVAAISVSVPTVRASDERLDEALGYLQVTAGKLSAEMGHRSVDQREGPNS